MTISRTVAKNTIFNFIGTATDVAVSFFVSIILARGLGTEQYGLYSFLMWFLSLVALIANMGLGEMARRYIAETVGRGDPEKAIGYAQFALLLRAAASLVIALLIILLSHLLTKVYSDVPDTIYFVLIAITLVPYGVANVLGSFNDGHQKYEYGAYVGMILSPLRLLGIIILMAMGYGVKEILIVTGALWVLGIVLNIAYLRSVIPWRTFFAKYRLNRAETKDAFKYNMTLMGIQGVTYFLWSQAEVLFLGLYASVEDIGFYNLAYKLPRMVINLIPFVLGRVLLPTVAEQFGKGNIGMVKTIYLNSARYLMMLSFPLVAGGIALSAPIVRVLYGVEYEPAIALMRVVFIPFSMMGLIHASTSIIYGINKPGFILKTGVVVMIVSVALYMVMIPKYGAMGAAIASSLPRIAVFPIYNYYVYKQIGVHWPLGDSIRTVVAALFMGGAVFGAQLFMPDLPSLVIGIPFGVVVYFIALILLGFVTPLEISMLKKAEKRIPSRVRSQFSSVVGLVEKFARKS